jgi:ABC-type phosphate transport system substrate-binding protein
MSTPVPLLQRPAALRPRGLLLLLPLLAAVAALAPLLVGPAPAVAAGPDVAVIVNGSNPVSSLAASEVSDLFLKRGKTTWPDGERVLPVDLAEQPAVREAFCQKIHGRGQGPIQSYWQKQIFSGRAVPPVEKGSAAQVIAFVRANKGGIGYVPAGLELGAGVKVLQVTP